MPSADEIKKKWIRSPLRPHTTLRSVTLKESFNYCTVHQNVPPQEESQLILSRPPLRRNSAASPQINGKYFDRTTTLVKTIKLSSHDREGTALSQARHSLFRVTFPALAFFEAIEQGLTEDSSATKLDLPHLLPRLRPNEDPSQRTLFSQP